MGQRIATNLKAVWKGCRFAKFSMWKGKGSGPQTEHPRMKIDGVLPPGGKDFDW